MESSTGLLKIGDFARAAGTNLRTLRYYEELGLLAPTKRSEGGFRYYRTVDLHRVRSIQLLQELGLSLEEIGEVLSCRSETPDRATLLEKVEVALNRQEELVLARLERLEAQRRSLAEAREREVRNFFDKFDVDGSGTIDMEEILAIMEEMGLLKNLKTDRITFCSEMFVKYDANDDGVLR